jgi:hypothetical protein
MKSTKPDIYKRQQLTVAASRQIDKKRLRWLTAAIGGVAALVAATVAFGITPANGGLAGGTTVTINHGLGDQTDPHVNGDLAVYTDANGSTQIRYYNFVTTADNAIPPAPGANDILSDVFGNLITFTRVSGGTTAMLFDVTTNTVSEIFHEASPAQFSPVLGGHQVAFIDLNLGSGDIMLFDLSTNGPPINVSHSVESDDSPSLSPAGDAVVWERCVGANCDILRSLKVGPTWGPPEVVSATPFNEGNPDTDGTWVVYDSNRPSATGGDIYFQPLSGGAETQIELAGEQRNPSISNGVIAFESDPGTGSADIYVYVIAANTLLQVTNTPTINDTLNDVTVLGNGDVRVVWSANDGPGQNVYGRTFSLPASNVVYNFNGFFQPIDNLPTLNIATAGSAIPVKFSLGGNQGLAIFASGFPASSAIGCETNEPGVVIEETVNPGNSSLSYNAGNDQYSYVCKTDKAWKGTCRMLGVKFNDGTQHLAKFRFR